MKVWNYSCSKPYINSLSFTGSNFRALQPMSHYLSDIAQGDRLPFCCLRIVHRSSGRCILSMTFWIFDFSTQIFSFLWVEREEPKSSKIYVDFPELKVDFGIIYKIYGPDNISFIFPHQLPIAFIRGRCYWCYFCKGLKSEEMERCWAGRRNFLWAPKVLDKSKPLWDYIMSLSTSLAAQVKVKFPRWRIRLYKLP